MVHIKLHGSLGEAMGRSDWSLIVKSPGEALRAIQANTRGKLYSYLGDKANEGIQYAVLLDGKTFVDEAELIIGRESTKTIDIVPVVAGGGGLWKIIAGVLLIIVAVVISVYVPGAGVGLLHLAVGLMTTIGLSLALGGISELLTKAPKLGTNPQLSRAFKDDHAKTGDQKVASYLFSGVSNTTRQGNVVPIGYGRHRIGSQVISFGISKNAINYTPVHPTPPNAADPFLNSPGFTTLENSSYAQLVPSAYYIRHLKLANVLALADQFGLRTGHTNASSVTIRAYLVILSWIFSGPHESVSFNQLVSLYKWLGLTSLPVIHGVHYRWQDYLIAIATHYIPGITF